MSFMPLNYWTQPYMVDEARSPRVMMINETDPERAIKMQADWLAKHYPGFQVIQLAAVSHKNRIHSRVTLQTANGQRKVVLFDVTAAYNSNVNTSMRNPPAGTLLRFRPGAGSARPRLQILR